MCFFIIYLHFVGQLVVFSVCFGLQCTFDSTLLLPAFLWFADIP